MAQATLTLTVRVSWWVRPYLQCVALFAYITGMTPDMDKVTRTAMRGVKAGELKGRA
jgi:hypothetical protein